MPVDIKAAATQKLGPLPAWGWGLALGGAVLVARLFRKPSGASVSGAAPTSVGGGGSVIGSGGDATPTDPFSGANSLVEQLQEQVGELGSTVTSQTEKIAGLSSTVTSQSQQITGLTDVNTQQQTTIAGLSQTISSITDFQGLQTKLIALLKQRSDALSALATWKTNLNTYQDALRACKTTACKTKQKANISTANSNITKYSQQASSLNTQITTLQTQLNGSNA